MADNKGDNIIRDRMGDIQVSFDKEAAWSRLQPRIESRPAVKPLFFLKWAAAAVLLIALSVWYLMPHVQEPGLARAMINPVKKPDPTTLQTTVISHDIAAIIRPAQNTTTKPYKQQENNYVTSMPVPEIIKCEPPAVVYEDTTPITPQIAKQTVPKPVIRLVHINEVADEERIEQAMQRMQYAEAQSAKRVKNDLPEDAATPAYHNQFKIDFTP